MKDLNKVTLEDFQSCVEQIFIVMSESEKVDRIEVELIQVKPIVHFDPDVHTRQPFSVLFCGPIDTLLSQGVYQIENVIFGECILFLVPVGADSRGQLYEATFN